VKAMNLTTKRWRQWGIIIPLLALLETSSWGSTNATAGSPPTPEGNRFLLILETSKGMQRQGEAALAAIDELLSSGMHGQLQSGDTVGLWTYNEQLYAGRLPAQGWTPQTAKEVRERIVNFIMQQKFEKSGNLEKVLPKVARVVSDSELITVILVSSGEENIAGTPYDNQINEYYKTWRERQRKAFKPFVTVFRGERGKLTRYSVSPVPWPIEIPALPPERAALHLAQNKAVPAPAKKVAPPIGKPLIVTGSPRKTEAVEVAKPTQVTLPVPQAPVSDVPKDPRVETAEEIVARLLAEAGQSQAVTTPPKVVSLHGSASNQATAVVTDSTKAAAAVVPEIQKPMPEHALIPPTAIATLTPQTVRIITGSSTNAVPAKTVEPAIIVKAEPILPKPELVKTSTIAVASTASRISESPARAQQAAPAALPESFLERKPIQLAAIALAAGAIVCLCIAARRSKPVYRPSIITRSLERESR
jgi:hypothetical protein